MALNEPSNISRLQTVRGMKLWNVNGALDAVHSAITTGAYTTGYALHLGASSAMIGLLSAAPSLGQILQAFSPILIERLPRRKPLCLIGYALSYLLWLPIVFIPFIFVEGVQPLALIVFIALGGAAVALGMPAQSSWMTDLVPGDVRGRFVARQQSIIAIVGLVTSLAAGVYMDLFEEPSQQIGFTSLFLMAVGFGLVSIWVWSRIPEPSQKQAVRVSPIRMLALPFRHIQFRRLTMLISGRLFVAQIAAPFFTVYMLQNLEMPYSQIALFTALQTLANIAVNPLWGYMADKFGYKPVLLICAAGLAFFPLWWVFITVDNYLWLVPAAQIWGGVMSGGIPIAQFNLMVKTAPETYRSVYIGFYAAMARVAVALGSSLGGALAVWCATFPPLHLADYTFSDLQYLFFIGFILRLSWVGLITRVTEEESMSTRHVLDQMSSGNPISTLWHLIRMGRSTDPDVRSAAARQLGDTGSALGVDELIKLLGDTDRAVRREAVRALGRVGDERAVIPLLESIGDPSSDIAEEAIETLGAIPSPLSLNILVTLLNDSRPSIRKSAALALGRMRDRRAREALERLLTVEQDHPVVLAATESLSKIGDERVLPRLQQLLRDSEPGIERRSLAHSISHLLDASEPFYRLQQMSHMDRDETIARIFRSTRRRLSHWNRFQTSEQDTVNEQMEKGLQSYEQERYEETLEILYRISDLAMRRRPPAGALRTVAIYPSEPVNSSIPLLSADMDDRPLASLIHGFITEIYEESRARPLLHEEFLLAIVAFQRLEEEIFNKEG